MSKPLERSCGRGIRSSMPKAAISDSGFGMKSGARWQGSAVRNRHKWECRPDVPQHSLHDPVDAKSVVGPISTVATEAGQSGHFRSSSNLPEIRGFGLGRKVSNSDIAFGNGRVTFR